MTIYPQLGAITRADHEALRSVLVVGATEVIQRCGAAKAIHRRLVELVKRSRPSLPPWRWPTKPAPAQAGDARIAWKPMGQKPLRTSCCRNAARPLEALVDS